MPLNILEMDNACTNCIKCYSKKHSLKKGDKFEIVCNGIPKSFDMHTTMSDSPMNLDPSILTDPVKWASTMLDWHCLDPNSEVWKRKEFEEYSQMQERYPGRPSKYHRPYQAEMLRCTAKRKVFRIGRQAGKCLPSGTLIQMADGTQKPIELVNDGDLVVSMNDNYQSITTPAFRACNGEKEVVKITLMDGREIEATYNHPFLTRTNVSRETTGKRRAIFFDEWKPVEELTEDDYLAVPRNIELNRQELIADYHLTVLGSLLADGNITGRNCRFSNTNSEILSHLRNALKYFQCTLKQYPSDNSDCDYHIVGSGIGKKHGVKDWMRKLDLQGLNSHEKYIPDFFMTLGNENIRELLRCMFGCDGWASVCSDGSVEIGYSTVSGKLAQQVVALLMRFGIYSTMQTKTVKLDGKKFLSNQLTITRKESIANFRNKIGILGKDDDLEKVYQISQQKNKSFKTEAYEDDDLVFIKIRSIEHVGTKMTWDLSVPETKNFVANNILTHNTETLVISMLFHIFTNNNFHIVLITPFQSQIDMIFKRLEQLIAGNVLLSNSIRRNVKAPQYSLELHNGSHIKGFTAGTKSGSGAASARGQSASMLVFDEADYLSSDDMDAAMAITTNFPNATVWMSSTPTGRREKFYQNCNSKKWKEFHLPSYVNPNWNAELEANFREEYTEIGYKHEILADFGEQEEGVFQVPYVEAARAEYEYQNMTPDHRTWVYSIGVDWNSIKNGTTIRVTGFNQADGHFYIVERHIVQRAGWTQLTACEAIVEMNRKWRPFAIYVDEGFGATQIEVLRKFGFDALADPEKGKNNVDARLATIVKPYKFGSTIEILDLHTKQPVKKPAKGFLVENAVREFESGKVRFPESDTQLEKELLNYIIKSVSPTGQIVYGQNDEAIGDHNLDALMLSLVAFTLEKSDFGRSIFDPTIKFSSTKSPDSIFSGEYPQTLQRAREEHKPGSRSDPEASGGKTFGHRPREELPLWAEDTSKDKRVDRPDKIAYVGRPKQTETRPRKEKVGLFSIKRGKPPNRSTF